MKLYTYQPVERVDGLKDTSNYAEKTIHLDRYLLVANDILKHNKKKRVLDIACGTGYGGYLIHQKTGAHVTGVDLDKNVIKIAKKHYSTTGTSYSVGSITHIPYKAESFDYVVCYETIEHISRQDAHTALKEINRVLVKGGILFISSPNKIFTSLLSIFGLKNPYHIHEYVPSELSKTIKSHEFTIYERWGQSCYFPITYLLARKKILPPSYFYPSRLLPQSVSMYFINKCIKV